MRVRASREAIWASFLFYTLFLILVGSQVVRPILNPRVGLPDRSALAAAQGVPQLPTLVPGRRDSYFSLPGYAAPFYYTWGCGDDDHVAAAIRSARGRVSVLYDPNAKTFKGTGQNYYDMYELRGDQMIRSYEQCEASFIESNREWAWWMGGLFVLFAFGWIGSARAFFAKRRVQSI